MLGMHQWPHAPSRAVHGPGTYIVTAATLHKEHFFKGAADLDLLHDSLLVTAEEFGWRLEAWAVFSNHYHFVGFCQDESRLDAFTRKLHGLTAIQLNKRYGFSGRKVWFQYWQTRLTYEKSYFARLNYVHHNPVKHGLVSEAADYRWCSARWFEEGAPRAFVDMVRAFPIDRISVPDDF
jgi:putative transposase